MPENIYEKIIANVDSLEGFHGDDDLYNHYNRKKVEVNTPSGTVTAWAYFASESEEEIKRYYEQIVSGDYLQYINNVDRYESRSSRRRNYNI
ncbi:hypothetical protein D3C72_1578140 [compost metagenome]